MEKSRLKPYVRKGLDILFVGLNPAKGSSDNGHYFSVNQAFWNQLHRAGLLKKNIDKSIADEIVFGGNSINCHGWQYGITDLEPKIAESNSSLIKTYRQHCERIENVFIELKPRVVVLLHSKVQKIFLEYVGVRYLDSNQGEIGKIVHGIETNFWSIAFPHGNAISSNQKVKRYIEIIGYLTK